MKIKQTHDKINKTTKKTQNSTKPEQIKQNITKTNKTKTQNSTQNIKIKQKKQQSNKTKTQNSTKT